MNKLGNFVRERRQDLGLTQEEVANRIGGSATQAEISRLERGTISFPRRTRLEGLAAALEVTLGELLLHSGWLTSTEQVQIDEVSTVQSRAVAPDNASVLVELEQLREALLTIIDRIGSMEAMIRQAPPEATRPEVGLPAGVFDDWERSSVFRP